MKEKKIDLTALKNIMKKEAKTVSAWLKKYNWRSATIWEWENGTRKPTVESFKRLSDNLYGDREKWALVVNFFT